jgi:O-acetyl-ADP-ribose deacetylase (regulator of RNase III)
LLDADVDALVNTVNTVGIMGKGIALQFQRAFPAMFLKYESDSKSGKIRLGQMNVFPTELIVGPKFIINFPTKRHWRSPSKISDIQEGLEDLVRVIRELGIKSIAIPPLGCGNGGLDWRAVRPLILSAMNGLTDVEVRIFPPDGAPAASEMRTNSERPEMSIGKAVLVEAVARYNDRTLSVSQIEIQKLMYFLQVDGQDLRLAYAKGIYGPYADNLRKSLERVEGHFLIGYGDGSQPVTKSEDFQVINSSRDEAMQVLNETSGRLEHLDRVFHLIEGFESSYGLELLATVHWVVTNESKSVELKIVIEQVQQWSNRKKGMFKSEHIEDALNRLDELGWLTGYEVVATN